MTDDIQAKIAEYKTRHPLAETIGQYVKLKKVGNEFKGLCPFHAESTPSFTVYRDRNNGDHRFKCHGCGEGGDVIDFLSNLRNVTVGELLEEERYPSQATTVKRPTPISTPDELLVDVGPKVTPTYMPAPPPELLQARRPLERVMTFPIYSPSRREMRCYSPAHIAAYRDEEGWLLGYVIRLEWIDKETGKKRKAPLPVRWCSIEGAGEDIPGEAWAFAGWEDSKPIYRIETLGEAIRWNRTIAGILWVEGEKKADAAAKLLEGTDWIILAWSNGSRAVEHAEVDLVVALSNATPHYIWPDADECGMAAGGAMARLINHHATAEGVEIWGIQPPDGVVKGWDLGDANKEGWTGLRVLEHILRHRKVALDFFPSGTEVEPTVPAAPDECSEIPNMSEFSDDPLGTLLQRIEDGDDMAVFDPLVLARLALLKAWDLEPILAQLAKRKVRIPPVRNALRDFIREHRKDKSKQTRCSMAPTRDGAVQALGIFDERQHVFRSAATGLILYLRAKEIGEPELLELAKPSYWEDRYLNDNGGIDVTAARRDLIDACQEQGIFDPSQIRGRGCWMEANDVIVHLGDRLVVNGEVMSLCTYKGRYVYPRMLALASTHIQLEHPLTNDEGHRLVRILAAPRWESPSSHKLLAGWLACAAICGTLAFRPHIWIYGAAGSGKSSLMKLIHQILGSLAVFAMSSSSEAGIRQQLELDSLPVLFDEAETNDERGKARIQAVLELARGSATETNARIHKGSAEGSAKQYDIRSMFLFSSIKPSLKEGADTSRFTKLFLRNAPDAKVEPERYQTEETNYTEVQRDIAQLVDSEFSPRFFARMIQLAPAIRANAQTLASVAGRVLGTRRNGDAVGTQAAGYLALTSDAILSPEEAERYLRAEFGGDLVEFVEDSRDRDEQVAAEHLMASRIEVQRAPPGGGTIYRVTASIGQLLQDATTAYVAGAREPDALINPDLANLVERGLGLITGAEIRAVYHRDSRAMRVEVADGELYLRVANRHPELQRIYGGTKYNDDQSWSEVLKMLSGALPVGKTSIGPGLVARSVAVPLTTLGIDVQTDTTEAAATTPAPQKPRLVA